MMDEIIPPSPTSTKYQTQESRYIFNNNCEGEKETAKNLYDGFLMTVMAVRKSAKFINL